MEDWELDDNYYIYTSDFKSINQYTGISFSEIENIPYYLFCLYKRDAWIHSLKQNEPGRKFLKDLKDLTTTQPDYKALRKVVTTQVVETNLAEKRGKK